MLGLLHKCFLDYKKSDERAPCLRLLDRNHILAIFIYVFCFAVMLVLTAAPVNVSPDPYLWTTLGNCMYVAFSRPGLLLCICTLVLLMWLNNGHRLKRFLACQPMAVLGKLVFAAYLCFPIANTMISGTRQKSVYLSVFNVLYLMIFNLVWGLIFGLVFYFLVQKPIDNLIFGS
mmetsp:Transcript_43167/g.31534  ORF Transcript_43167/g.31534 Transcript_43167/m.31534 type:complete len:174 (-) Transcript_43167:108-629(-)